MNIISKLFHLKSPFDQLVEIFGGSEKLRFWNGTNYGPEVMFKRGPDPDRGRDYYTFNEPPPFVKLSMGWCNPSWDDWAGKTYENCIEIYVHQNTMIMWRSAQVNGDWSGKKRKRLQKRINKLLLKLKVGYFLETDNEMLRKVLATFFEARPESRCRHCISLSGITESHLESMKQALKESEDEYAQHHAIIEVISKTNGAHLGSFSGGLDAAEGFVLTSDEVVSHCLEDYEFKVH